ncbi:hypothetical protein ACRALDRAFT_1064795 [Sodiomyces alcalophilus JCM 7366]|uniref:uncharacterized protein n=1 Tax=Sodiomyces alcalophilus JCM 7366 TaxID=591952 RepID=UPI0039B62FFA
MRSYIPAMNQDAYRLALHRTAQTTLSPKRIITRSYLQQTCNDIRRVASSPQNTFRATTIPLYSLNAGYTVPASPIL